MKNALKFITKARFLKYFNLLDLISFTILIVFIFFNHPFIGFTILMILVTLGSYFQFREEN